MKKKIYTAPALSVEEYEMIIITSASKTVSSVESGGLFEGTPQAGNGQGNSAAQGKQRNGIWDD